ncbi:unnamed protein product [Allacma fusca]|uniref:Uncharacterized protein n=1 Tax=Allacma fusca TaxID=39272 RepID=A0A8J2PFJ9_9HEXA|nr:unnamed protein product [Allacma fusca]
MRYIPSITFFLNIIKNARGLLSKYIGHWILINTNVVAESGLRLLKPILGGLFDRFTVYGNNKAAWLPKFLKIVPKQALPDWYGDIFSKATVHKAPKKSLLLSLTFTPPKTVPTGATFCKGGRHF